MILTDKEKQILNLIEKRRRQIIIHSCAYYIYDKSLITDK